MAKTMEAPESGVTVRMYKAGLGDCFLLAFPGAGGSAVYVLIDCGVHSQYKGGSDRIREIAEHIRVSTGGHLHVVVATHEHADHISGFHQARATFKNMHIDEAWFGWTEDRRNALAGQLDRERSLMLNGLSAAAPTLAAADPSTGEKVEHLLGFFKIEGALGVSTREVRDAIPELVTKCRFLKPKKKPLTLPDVDGVRIFVLGPPEDVDLLMRARPSSRPGEVYREGDQPLTPDATLSAAFLAAGAADLDNEARRCLAAAEPFASNVRHRTGVVEKNPELYRFFHEHYGFGPNDEESWRRIDGDWYVPAETLALRLDAATNNTSLVLAIELKATGRVLLFAGDAQVGNWLSWHEGGWSQANGLARGETVTAEDLLGRTVLYKVGHHGSHNATLREKGLEMMSSPELSAMIPVDRGWALKRKPHPWKMPFDPLYEDLLGRSGSRILRSDVGLVKPKRETGAWRAFKKRVRRGPLFVELDVPDA